MHEDPSRLPPPPWHLWFVAGSGLLWNSVGAFDFAMMQSRNDAYMARFNPDQLEVLLNLPTWLIALWGTAVWSGVLGALLVSARRRAAVPVLLVSLGAMTATAVHNVMSDAGLYAAAGTGHGFVGLIFLVALGLAMYARSLARAGSLT